jgi:hypothetical protein
MNDSIYVMIVPCKYAGINSNCLKTTTRSYSRATGASCINCKESNAKKKREVKKGSPIGKPGRPRKYVDYPKSFLPEDGIVVKAKKVKKTGGYSIAKRFSAS